MREEIALALFAKLNTTAMKSYFKEISRRPKLWDQATVFPCLFLAQPEEDKMYKHGTATPGELSIDFDVFAYFDTSLDPNIVPDTQLNTAIEMIEAAIAGDFPGQPQTLGGLVNHTWIEGKITRVPGYVDGHGMLYFTIRVLVP